MAPTARTPRRFRLAAAGAIGALAVSACAPIITDDPYAASDGIRVEIADGVRGENLLIVTAAEGEPGVLLGGITNESDEPADVTISIGAATAVLDVGARSTVLLSAPDALDTATASVETVEIEAVPVAPGALADVELSTPSGGTVTVGVPVLDGTLTPYDEVVPGGFERPEPVEEEPAEDDGH